jgi:hypothetical protein
MKVQRDPFAKADSGGLRVRERRPRQSRTAAPDLQGRRFNGRLRASMTGMKHLLDSTGKDRWLRVTSVGCERRNLLLRFELFPESSDDTPPTWLVSCREVREFSLSDFDGGGLNWWKRKHPLLAQFSSPKASLEIDIGDRSHEECAGLLLQAHRRSVDDWIDFDKFISPTLWGTARRQRFAIRGPEYLLRTYHDQLEAAGFRAKLKKHKRALYWSGFGWSERRHAVSALHFGKSFVVAESFFARPDAPKHQQPNGRSRSVAARNKTGHRLKRTSLPRV